MKSYYSHLSKLSDTHLGDFKREFEQRVLGTRNKSKAYKDYLRDYHYPKRDEVQARLGYPNSLFFSKVYELYEDDISRSYEQIFNDEIEKIPDKARNVVLKDLAIYDAVIEFEKFYRSERYKYTESISYTDMEETPIIKGNSRLKWNGTNETEFIQFVYALHEAGYLCNQENEITKLVEQMALLFNFNLGRNWQINLSTSINKRNADYMPEIFANLSKGFATYRLKQLEKNKKNKAK